VHGPLEQSGVLAVWIAPGLERPQPDPRAGAVSFGARNRVTKAWLSWADNLWDRDSGRKMFFPLGTTLSYRFRAQMLHSIRLGTRRRRTE
jgi:hypothetical protein